MIGKILRYTFIALVFLAIFAFCFKLDDIVGGLPKPIQAKKTANLTITKPTEVSTNKQQSTVAPTTNKPAASITPVVTASTKTVTPVSTPAPVQTTPVAPVTASTPTPTNSDKEQGATNQNGNYYDGWGNEFDYMGNLVQVANCSIPVNSLTGPNPYCTQ